MLLAPSAALTGPGLPSKQRSREASQQSLVTVPKEKNKKPGKTHKTAVSLVKHPHHMDATLIPPHLPHVTSGPASERKGGQSPDLHPPAKISWCLCISQEKAFQLKDCIQLHPFLPSRPHSLSLLSIHCSGEKIPKRKEKKEQILTSNKHSFTCLGLALCRTLEL